MNKTILLVFIGVVVLAVAVYLLNGDMKPGSELDTGTADVVDQVDGGDEVMILTQERCQAAGGDWNPCGSACRTNPNDICIEVCVEYCECTDDSQCPESTTCQDFVDGVGVCAAGG